MPPRKLSSDVQGLLVFITLALLLAAIGAFLLLAVRTRDPLFVLGGLQCVPLGALAWYLARLRRVVVLDDALCVRHLFRVDRVPLENVSHFRAYQATNGVFLTLYLRSPCRFGSRVRFLSSMHFGYAQNHPDVVWLQQRCGLATQPKRGWWLLLPYLEFRSLGSDRTANAL